MLSLTSKFFFFHYFLYPLRISIFILQSLHRRDCGEDSTILFYNNIGVVHYAMGKPNLACHYFQCALKEDLSRTAIKDEQISDRPLYKFGTTKYHEIVYNLGLALLRANKPVQAFECLIIAVRRFHRNSRLWLRLAECCIINHKEVKLLIYIHLPLSFCFVTNK